MKEFLKKKGVSLDPRVYFIDALGAMAFGLFASLLIGTIINSVGKIFDLAYLTDRIWPLASAGAGAAIATSIAYSLDAPKLVLFANTIVGLSAYELGGPVGVYVASIFAVEFGKIVSKSTKIDIIITPLVTILAGVVLGDLIGPYVSSFMTMVGEFIVRATEIEPFFMGIIVSVLIGITLTLPISSAAICMMLSLSGLAAGAATVGCCSQMIGFAVISYRDNGLEGLFAQGLGTSMFQVPNTIKNPWIWLPPTLTSAILGPLSTIVFKMTNTPLGAGMGTSGLVGQIGTFQAMAGENVIGLFIKVIGIQIILPAILSILIYSIMRKNGLIKDGDMKIDF